MDYEKRSTVQKVTGAVKDYFGPIPFATGLIAAGAVPLTAYACGIVYNSSDQIVSYFQNGNVDLVSALYSLPESIPNILSKADGISSNLWKAGFLGGQFLGYLFKRKILNPVKNLVFKKRR